MYCIKCGVELKDSEKICPLCGTKVFHPDILIPQGEKQYPEFEAVPKKINRHGMLFVMTVIFLIPLLLTLLIDVKMNLAVTWSGYVIGGLILGYVFIVLPLWFKRPNPVVFTSISCAASILFVLYVSIVTGGKWFLSLALPVAGVGSLILISVVTLLKYLKRGKLYVFGGAFIALGGYCVLIELFTVITFKAVKFVFWSIYPLVACLLVGILLITIAVCKPLQSTLDKRFFI